MKKKEKQHESEPVKSFCLNKISAKDAKAKAKANEVALEKISKLLIEEGVGGSKFLLISSDDVDDLIIRVKYLLLDLEASKRENKYFRAMLERGE